MKNKEYEILFSRLLSLFPNPDTELNFSTPFQLLVAVILSAQSTDKQVNKITDNLFLKIKHPSDILQRNIEDLTNSISSINYYRMKANHIFQTAKRINELALIQNSTEKLKLTKNEKKCFQTYGYYLPESIEGLIQFPGVGEKTAKVFLYVRYHHPLIAVDTHVHRVTNRLGIVTTKEPIETSKQIESIIPIKRKLVAHHIFILFGRYYCTARNPKCANCIIQEFCKHYQQITK